LSKTAEAPSQSMIADTTGLVAMPPHLPFSFQHTFTHVDSKGDPFVWLLQLLLSQLI